MPNPNWTPEMAAAFRKGVVIGAIMATVFGAALLAGSVTDVLMQQDVELAIALGLAAVGVVFLACYIGGYIRHARD